jgi:D-arabinose 1-dehydrogenase-like Zn-dependent alcohol dehydrogenase
LLGLNSGLVAGLVADAVTCGRSRVKGSGIGSIEATQAVINLCAKHDIKPEIEVVAVEGINKVCDKNSL